MTALALAGMSLFPQDFLPRVGRWITVCLAIALLASSFGCVRRRLTIRSDPAGAVAYVDDQAVGMTPVSTPFTFYGTRKIQLFRDGYETLTVKQKFNPPWYEIPPLDFLVENLWPGEVRDERIVDFQMQPQQIVPNQELLNRAEALRTSTRQGFSTPLPQTPPPFRTR